MGTFGCGSGVGWRGMLCRGRMLILERKVVDERQRQGRERKKKKDKEG